MGWSIRDGAGKGNSARVDDKGRLWVDSKSLSMQHLASHKDGQAYQVMGISTLANATVAALHIKNNSSDLDLVVTYIRHQIIDEAGGTALPNASNYLRVAFGRTYASGGAAVTPVNMNKKSGNDADVTAYQTSPTLAGTATEFDRWYTKAEADMHSWNKEGTVILGKNDTMELSYVGDHTSGSIFTRMSFVMQPAE